MSKLDLLAAFVLSCTLTFLAGFIYGMYHVVDSAENRACRKLTILTEKERRDYTSVPAPLNQHKGAVYGFLKAKSVICED